jgi:hypothetical protein
VYKRSPELLKQLTEALVKWNKKHRKGRKAKRELVEKQREGHLRYYQNHNAPNKGVAHTLETRRKISQSMKKHWDSDCIHVLLSKRRSSISRTGKELS